MSSSVLSNDGRISLLSGFSSIDKPPPEEGETPAQYRWRLLRFCVKAATKLVKNADLTNIFISHGIEHQRRILCHKGNAALGVCFNNNAKELVVLGNNLLQIRQFDGRLKRSMHFESHCRSIIHMHRNGHFVGWTSGADELILMNSQLEVTSISNASGTIFAATYNEYINEILTVGAGFLTNWLVRYGGRYILPRKTTENELLLNNKFSMLTIEPTASRAQRAYVASEGLVAVFSVQDGTLLKCAKDLHVRPITALLFFNPLKYLVTGCKDGSIKIWDENFHLQLVFVGHNGSITALSLHPHGPLFISASCDNTLRVWSLETCDEIDKVYTDGTVTTLVSQMKNDIICTISGEVVTDLWKMQHAYQLHTSIGFRVLSLKSTDHPHRPIRTLAICADSGLRLISPTTGEVITTFLGDKSNPLIDACYAIGEDVSFGLHSNGSIVKANMKTNPAVKVAEWPIQHEQALGTCIIVYEHVARRSKKDNAMATVADDEAPQKKKKGIPAADRTLLFVGRCDGSISNIDMETGHIDFQIEGHTLSAVSSLTTNHTHNQLISAGTDNTIRLWRVFAHARECLAPMYTFYCTYLPVAISSIKSNLIIAYQEHASATYMTSAYNLDTKSRFDHKPDDDHTDEISCLASCSTMKLFASCSKDGTVRIWTSECRLLRLIKLKAVATSVVFCSEKGDLLISIGSCVHKIDYTKYLPKAYRVQLLTKKLRPEVVEKALPFDEQLMAQLSYEENRRLKLSRSHFKFTHYVDVLTGDELKEMEETKKQREEAFGIIDARENEILKIRDGDIDTKPKKSAKTQQFIKKRAFDKYLKLFYDRPSVDMPKEDIDILQTAKDIIRLQEEGEPREPEWKPCPIQPVFFNLDANVIDRQAKAQLPICTDGQLPNSALLQPLKPIKALTRDLTSMGRYRPPEFTAEQLELINQHLKTQSTPLMFPSTQRRSAPPPSTEPTVTNADGNNGDVVDNADTVHLLKQYQKVRSTTDDADSEAGVRFLDYSDDESIRENREQSASSIARLNEILNKAEQKRQDTDAASVDEPVGEIHVHQADEKTIRNDNIERQPPQHKNVDLLIRDASDSSLYERKEKLKPKEPLLEKKASDAALSISSPVADVTTPKQLSPDAGFRRKVKFVSSPEPDTQVSVSPSERPPTPLPTFITQFRGESWFEKYFPNCNERTLPKPWDVASFVIMLVRVLKISEWSEKVEVMRAMRLLHQQETIPDLLIIMQAVYSIFNLHINPPRCSDPLGKMFIADALKLLQALGVVSRDYVTELFMQYLQGDREIKKLVLDCLYASGLEDRQNFIPSELESWDMWSIDDPDLLKDQLLKICIQFLDKWSTMLKNQLNETLSKLQQSPRLQRNKSGKPGTASSRQTATASSVDSTKQTRAQLFVNKLLTNARDSGKPVIIETLVDKGPYVNVLTFFCETQCDRQQISGATQMEQQKNTIVALPHIPTRFHLVRLGETHQSICRPHRETVYCTDMLPPISKSGQMVPGQLYGFPPFVNLPLKPIYIDPFGKDLEEAAAHDKDFLLMLRSAQKYFIQSRSYVDAAVQ